MADPNPVVRGYRWSQQFVCPAGTLEPLDEIESEVYYTRIGAKSLMVRAFKISSSTNGIAASEQTIQVDLTPAQTAKLVDGASLSLDFKRVRGGVEAYLGVKATIPIREPLTKGSIA